MTVPLPGISTKNDKSPIPKYIRSNTEEREGERKREREIVDTVVR